MSVSAVQADSFYAEALARGEVGAIRDGGVGAAAILGTWLERWLVELNLVARECGATT